MLTKSLLIGWALSAAVWAQASERKMTFYVEPAGAEVRIANHTGGYDRYLAGREGWVKFPTPAVNLEVHATGWKSQTIPVHVNQFAERWPVNGSLQLEPDSLAARLQLLPCWPLLFLLVVPLALRRKRPLPTVAPTVPQSGLPWELEEGETFAGYRVLQRLGEGVSAVVYRVAGSDGELALKLLKPQHFRDTEVLPRFRREMKSLTRLRHPGIPLLLDFGEERAMQYLVMELLSPRSLGDSLAEGPLPFEQRRTVLQQLTEALAVCHAQGILHRDIKPDNVVWGLDGKVRLTDFGLARPHDASTLTVEGSLLGTPAYMAPEVAQGEPTSASSDLYSLGCLAYHLCAGQPPFQGESPLAILVQHMTTPPPPLTDCEPTLSAWIERCLGKTPEERFVDCEQALQALRA